MDLTLLQLDRLDDPGEDEDVDEDDAEEEVVVSESINSFLFGTLDASCTRQGCCRAGDEGPDEHKGVDSNSGVSPEEAGGDTLIGSSGSGADIFI